MESGGDGNVDIYASMRGSRVDGLSEIYRMSVRTTVDKSAREEERLTL